MYHLSVWKELFLQFICWFSFTVYIHFFTKSSEIKPLASKSTSVFDYVWPSLKLGITKDSETYSSDSWLEWCQLETEGKHLSAVWPFQSCVHYANFEKAARIQVHWQEVDKNLPSIAPCLWPVRSYLGCAYPYAWRWQCECPFPWEQIWCCNGCHPDWQHHTTQRVRRGSSLRLSYQMDLYLPKKNIGLQESGIIHNRKKAINELSEPEIICDEKIWTWPSFIPSSKSYRLYKAVWFCGISSEINASKWVQRLVAWSNHYWCWW